MLQAVRPEIRPRRAAVVTWAAIISVNRVNNHDGSGPTVVTAMVTTPSVKPGCAPKSTLCDRWSYDQKHGQEARRAEDLKHRRSLQVEARGQNTPLIA
jgi:hypothetical protein